MNRYKQKENNNLKSLLNKKTTFLPEIICNYLKDKQYSLSPRTLYCYASHYITFLDYLINHNYKFEHLNPIEFELDDFQKIDAPDARAFNEWYKPGHSPASQKSMLSALSAFFTYLIETERLQFNPFLLVKRPSITLNKTNPISDSESNILLHNIQDGLVLEGKAIKHHERLWTRDYAMVMLILDLGLSVSDIADINIDDIDFNSQSITVLSRYHGWDTYTFTPKTAQTLKQYMNVRKGWKTIDKEALFLQRDGKRISVRSIQIIIKKYSSPLNSSHDSITPRTLMLSSQLRDI
ncbi:MAG: tyrosine-type recombinase/integrase [Butyrivibrio sp.]|nr:tyrosine-type recombinase/integrase [Butyrivibrio sp.]